MVKKTQYQRLCNEPKQHSNQIHKPPKQCTNNKQQTNKHKHASHVAKSNQQKQTTKNVQPNT